MKKVRHVALSAEIPEQILMKHRGSPDDLRAGRTRVESTLRERALVKSNLKILVVDDSAICREPIVAALNIRGFEAVGAPSGKEALALLQKTVPDLILLDLVMPELDGWSVLTTLRGDQRLAKTPVILLTSSEDKDCVVRAARLGVSGYLLKSHFSLEKTFAKIEECLRGTAAVASAAAQTPPSHDTAQTGKANSNPAPTQRPASATTRAKTPSTRDQTIQRIQDGTQAKTLAGVVAEVIALASSPRGRMCDLVGVLKKDPIIAARVLQVANSAKFTTEKPRVATLEEAVRNVGLSTVRNIATSVGIFEAFPATGVRRDVAPT
jgi:CheY-like chemotaxis protein